MNILLSFQFKDQTKENQEMWYSGNMDDFKREYQYVVYSEKNFEMLMYDSKGFNHIDAQCFYGEISSLPWLTNPKYVAKTGNYTCKPKCSCGADSVKSSRHSDWCPKYVRIINEDDY